MRVVHVITGLGVGGAEHLLRRLILTARATTDTEHVVVSLTTVGTVGDMLRDAGVAVEALGMRGALGVPRALTTLAARIRALRPDIVQTWMYHGDLVGGLAARLAGHRALIWGIRASEMPAGTPRGTAVVRWLCARLSSVVPAVIVCAAEAGRRAHAAIGYDESRMVVIPNGFSEPTEPTTPDDARALRDSLGWPADALVVGTVGRFDPYKDHRTFVRAAGALARREPRSRFLMVGTGLESGNAVLAQWIRDEGIADRVACVGPRADVPRYLRAMDVFALSSRSEGFPNVVGEAMLAGVPCVVTDVGDAALLVGDTGIVVPKEEPEAFADGLARVLALSAEARAALGARARERIRREYPMPKVVERFEAVYARVLAGARS